jgi:hypothetical protein
MRSTVGQCGTIIRASEPPKVPGVITCERWWPSIRYYSLLIIPVFLYSHYLCVFFFFFFA